MEREFGLELQDLMLWCAGLSQPQVKRQLRRWSVLWPRPQPVSVNLQVFERELWLAQRLWRGK
ncbi:MAG: hypothetical protein DLM66_00260 [Candidatus Dormiibacter spiritus]|nr:MAG: hypothetical protein DLM66_00260 [Candidatus Dormibacteraeota bacterium]